MLPPYAPAGLRSCRVDLDINDDTISADSNNVKTLMNNELPAAADTMVCDIICVSQPHKY